jgi:hypothetical protein
MGSEAIRVATHLLLHRCSMTVDGVEGGACKGAHVMLEASQSALQEVLHSASATTL